MKNTKPSKSWSPEQLADFYRRQGKAIPDETKKVLESLGLGSRVRLPVVAPVVLNELGLPTDSTEKKKRKGVDVAPILASLRAPLIYAATTKDPTLSLWFDGARLLTANELLSVLQYRKHQTYAYKKAWRKLVGSALECIPGRDRPYFDGPTRLWLYRRGKKLVDVDSMPLMFKYAIDALRREGVIFDDNPEIIVESKLVQEKGEPSVGIRLERMWDWTPPSPENIKQRWLGLL